MRKLTSAGLVMALVLSLLTSTASAHEPRFTQAGSESTPAERQAEMERQIVEMGYTLKFEHLPPLSNGSVVCGVTRTGPREIVINTFASCVSNGLAVLAHEIGHIVHTEPSFNSVDRTKFGDLVPSNQSFSGECDVPGNNLAYNNSFCEVYAGAAAKANGFPHQRTGSGLVSIKDTMVRAVRTDLMIQLDPVYSCQVALSYRMWLDRNADSNGYEYWMNKGFLNNWTVNNIVAGGIWPSAEFQNGAIINRTHWETSWLMISNAYGRPPLNWQEQDFWRDEISASGKRWAWEKILNTADSLNWGPCGTFASSRAYVSNL